MAQATIVETLQGVQQMLTARRDESGKPEAKREYALAITHVEDAIMRTNRGVSFDTFGDVAATSDLERVELEHGKHAEP